jgi:hypothetical protein
MGGCRWGKGKSCEIRAAWSQSTATQVVRCIEGLNIEDIVCSGGFVLLKLCANIHWDAGHLEA